MWSVEYVQVPDETKLIIPTEPEAKSAKSASTKMGSDKGKQSGKGDNEDKTDYHNKKRSASCDSYEEDSQSVVNRLQEFKDPDHLTSKYVELGSSVDSNSNFMSKVREKLEGAGNTGRESQSAIQGEGNLSEASSMSDLYMGEELGVDGEVQSVQSMSSAIEATEDLSHADTTSTQGDLVSIEQFISKCHLFLVQYT